MFEQVYECMIRFFITSCVSTGKSELTELFVNNKIR